MYDPFAAPISAGGMQTTAIPTQIAPIPPMPNDTPATNNALGGMFQRHFGNMGGNQYMQQFMQALQDWRLQRPVRPEDMQADGARSDWRAAQRDWLQDLPHFRDYRTGMAAAPPMPAAPGMTTPIPGAPIMPGAPMAGGSPISGPISPPPMMPPQYPGMPMGMPQGFPQGFQGFPSPQGNKNSYGDWRSRPSYYPGG